MVYALDVLSVPRRIDVVKQPQMLRFEKAVRAGVLASLVGVVLVAVAPLQSPLRTLGGLVVVVGWLAAAWSLHRYGRAR